MAVGLKTWDAAGNLIIDTATRMSRVIGMAGVSAGATGSITDAGFATGAAYCIALRVSAGTPTGIDNSLVSPIISFSGTTMSYNVASPAGDHLLIYGVY